MFEHSVKVPRHYKIVAKIIKKVSTEGGSVKTLLYDNKLRHFKTDVLYALITETIKHANELDKIFEECNLLKSEPRLDPWLAKVLATELLYGKKTLPGKSKPEETILSYKNQFEIYATENKATLKIEDIRRPRYVRINTNLLTTSDAIRAFQDEGFRFIRCTSGSYDDYLKQIQGLTEDDFTQDYHVKTVFVFAPGTKLHSHDLYLENKIILQDKATAMAVHLLAPPAGSVVMDMCAAPGNKTTQLAAFMRNQGKIYAVERNEQRYKTLCDFVEKTGSTSVQTLHKDSLELKRGDYDDVEYILLDPSCSGSGMTLSVHNYIDENRLAKLTSLQEKFLKHAMNAFPNAKKIVYSTCSLFPEENERVISNVVKLSRSKWRVLDVKEQLKGQWNNIGSGMYGSIGTRCMYARPDVDLTTGFFLAVLERDKRDLEKSQYINANRKENVEIIDNDSKEYLQTNKEKYKRKFETNEEGSNIKEENDEEFFESKKKKKKHKNKEACQNGDADIAIKAEAQVSSATEDCREEFTEKKKKKKHIKKEISETQMEYNELEANKNSEEVIDKKKKKKHKTKVKQENGIIESLESSIVDSEHHESNKIKHNKKKKKRETTDLPVNEVINEIMQKPKKKKTVELETLENIDFVQDNDLSQTDMNEIPKKKKKKKKEKNMSF